MDRYSFSLKGVLPGQDAVLVVPKEEHRFWLIYQRKHPEYRFQVKAIEDVENDFSLLASPRLASHILKRARDYERKAKEEGKEVRHLHSSDVKEIGKVLISPFYTKEPSCFASYGLSHLREEFLKEGYLMPSLDADYDYRNKIILVSKPLLQRIHQIFQSSHNSNLAVQAFLYPSQKRVQQKSIYAFRDRSEEVYYLLNEMTHLLLNGVSPDQIYVYGADEEAERLFRDLAPQFGVPVEKNHRFLLSSTLLFQDFIGLLQSYSPDDAYSLLKEDKYGKEEMNALRSLVRDYGDISQNEKENIALFEELGRNTPFFTPLAYDESIHFLSSLSLPPFSYLFMMSFDSKMYPFIASKGGFWSEEEKKEYGFETTEEENTRWLSSYESMKERGLIAATTFASKSSGGVCFPSRLESLPFVMHEPFHEKNNDQGELLAYVDYSHDKGKTFFSFLLDEKLTTGVERPFYEKAKALLPYPLFDCYNHDLSFASLESKTLSPCLSASSLKEFYSCPFSYFCEYVLKLEPFSSSFSSSLGNVIHQVLATLGEQQEDFSFSKTWGSAFYQEKQVREKEEPFSSLEYILFDIEKEHVQAIASSYATYFKHLSAGREFSVLAEKSFLLNPRNEEYLPVTGRFDAIYRLEGTGYLVVDYKSGHESFSLEGYRAGVKPQLPLYAYWSKKDGNVYDKRTGKKHEVLSKDEKLYGIFLAKCYGNNYPVYHFTPTRDLQIDDNSILKDLSFNGMFDPGIIETPFVFPRTDRSDWISGISRSKAGVRIKNPKERDWSDSFMEMLLGEKGKETPSFYFPSVEEEIHLASYYIQNNLFPISPLVLNLDAIEEEEAISGDAEHFSNLDKEEYIDAQNEDDALPQSKFTYMGCSYCPFHDVCYSSREDYRREMPDFKKGKLMSREEEKDE